MELLYTLNLIISQLISSVPKNTVIPQWRLSSFFPSTCLSSKSCFTVQKQENDLSLKAKCKDNYKIRAKTIQQSVVHIFYGQQLRIALRMKKKWPQMTTANCYLCVCILTGKHNHTYPTLLNATCISYITLLSCHFNCTYLYEMCSDHLPCVENK